MAAALSRALKLPGKKGSELGEYDPLTQADSEDESEEDDLVLNYPRNGLLGGGSSKLRGGRSGRLVEAEDKAQEDEDEEEGEWREQPPPKTRPERDAMVGMQYWSFRDLGRGQGRGQAGPDRGGQAAAAGLEGLSAEAEAKRTRMKHAVRSAFFLVPLVCASVLVMLCAFLIPCQKGALERRLQWERPLGVAGGVNPPALALWDVDGDSVEDVFLGVTEFSNDSWPGQGSKVYSMVALSAVRGQVLWRKVMHENVKYIQCGLQFGSQQPPVVIVIGKSIVMAVDPTSGESVWSVLLKNIVSQAVLLPDLQGDLVPDLLIATLPADEASDLSLTLISGLTGAKLGHPVPFNLTGQGRLIGPLLHETSQGAFYVLFGLGNVEAILVGDIYMKANSVMLLTPALRSKDPTWEGLKKNGSSLIKIYRGAESAQFLLPLVAGFGNNRYSLDPASNQNFSRSDWVLVYGSSRLSVLRQRDVRKEWTFDTTPLHCQPVPGHFNEDGVLDLFVQHAANGTMQAQVVDGAKGKLLWSAEFVCPGLMLESSAISTSTGQSAFLFWASDPIVVQKNGTKATVSPGVAAAQPLIRKLFLLHPTYPRILLELHSTTDTAVTSAVSYHDHQKDAFYITASSRPTPDSEPGTQIIKSLSLRSAIATGTIVQLGDGNDPGEAGRPAADEIYKFFRSLTFRQL